MRAQLPDLRADQPAGRAVAARLDGRDRVGRGRPRARATPTRCSGRSRPTTSSRTRTRSGPACAEAVAVAEQGYSSRSASSRPIRRRVSATSRWARRWATGPARARGRSSSRSRTRQRAEEYLATGRFRWNAGMFVVRRVRAARPARRSGTPTSPRGCGRIAADPARLDEVWPALEKIAIDHAVAEPAAAAGRVAVVPGGFGWDDVGDFASLGGLLRRTPPACRGARVLGDAGRVRLVDSTGVVVPVERPGRGRGRARRRRGRRHPGRAAGHHARAGAGRQGGRRRSQGARVAPTSLCTVTSRLAGACDRSGPGSGDGRGGELRWTAAAATRRSDSPRRAAHAAGRPSLATVAPRQAAAGGRTARARARRRQVEQRTELAQQRRTPRAAPRPASTTAGASPNSASASADAHQHGRGGRRARRQQVADAAAARRPRRDRPARGAEDERGAGRDPARAMTEWLASQRQPADWWRARPRSARCSPRERSRRACAMP